MNADCLATSWAYASARSAAISFSSATRRAWAAASPRPNHRTARASSCVEPRPERPSLTIFSIASSANAPSVAVTPAGSGAQRPSGRGGGVQRPDTREARRRQHAVRGSPHPTLALAQPRQRGQDASPRRPVGLALDPVARCAPVLAGGELHGHQDAGMAALRPGACNSCRAGSPWNSAPISVRRAGRPWDVAGQLTPPASCAHAVTLPGMSREALHSAAAASPPHPAPRPTLRRAGIQRRLGLREGDAWSTP